MVPFLAIGAFAGLRSAEIERLDWVEVHLADRFIEVKADNAKTASRRIVPTAKNLAHWLAPHARNEGRIIFQHYRELVRPGEAKKWFGIQPDSDGSVTVISSSERMAVAEA
jgi:integrase